MYQQVTLRVPSFPGFQCVDYRQPKKDEYYYNVYSRTIQTSPHDYIYECYLIYTKCEQTPKTETTEVNLSMNKIPEFPGYTFDRIGTPKINEYFMNYIGQLIMVELPYKDKNYVIYHKTVEPTTLKFVPWTTFVGVKLESNQYLIVIVAETLNFSGLYSASTWNGYSIPCSENYLACLVTFEKESK